MRLATMLAAAGLAAATLNPITTANSFAEPCCIKPDNGGGTADIPPTCTYNGHMIIVDGLAPGTTVQIQTELVPLNLSSVGLGGSLGGTFQQWTGVLTMHMAGTGTLAGYVRTVHVPISNGETHSAGRIPFTPVQSFPEVLWGLQGQISGGGDPDFDLLRVTAGNGFGMPSPGHTTLTQQPGNQWAVDSFFDITYRIDFVGHPGSQFGGMSGSTTDTKRHEICPNPTATEPTTFARVKALYR